MGLVRFEQDENAPPGAGMFHFDNGQSTYAYSPEDAAPFLAQEPEPDMRLASSNPADVYNTPAWQQSMGDGSSYINPESLQSRADFAPDMSGGYSQREVESQAPGESSGTNMSQAPGKETAAAKPAAKAVPRMAAPTGQPSGAAGSAPAKKSPTDPALAQFGPAPKGMQVKDYSVQFQDAGLPYSQEDAGARAEASLNQAQVRQKWTDIQSAQLQAEHYAAVEQAAKMREQVAQRQARVAKLQNDYRTKRTAVQQEVDDAAKEKVDPDHFFASRGPLARITAALAQAFGAFGATLGRTPNFAQQIVDGEIDRDIAAQRENINRHGAHAKNKLSQLMQDYGLDIDEATGMLRSSQQQLAEQQVRAHAAMSKDVEVQKAQEEWLAQRAIDREEQERKLMQDSVGKRSGTVKFARADAGAGSALPPALKAIYGNDIAAAREDYRAFLTDQAAKGNTHVGWADFANRAAQAGAGKLGAGGAGGARLGMAAERAGLGARALDEFEKAIDAGADRGYLSGKLTALANTVGGALGTQSASLRDATRKGATAEVAAALSGGSPTDTMLHEIGQALDTNDPNKAKAVIHHYRGMLQEAERRYVSRAGKGHSPDAADVAYDAGEGQ